MIYELVPIELHEDRIGGMCEAALRRLHVQNAESHRLHQRAIVKNAASLWLEIAPPVRVRSAVSSFLRVANALNLSPPEVERALGTVLRTATHWSEMPKPGGTRRIAAPKSRHFGVSLHSGT